MFNFIKIILYAAFVFLLYKSGKNKANTRTFLASSISLSLSIGYYAIICSTFSYGYDRQNYAIRFAYNYPSPWTLGLNTLAEALHFFTYDPAFLFFSISFLCVWVTLLAYKNFDDVEPSALLLLGLSQYFIYSFYLLKQAPSIAFASLSISMLLKNKYLIAIILLAISISFHESAYILIPLFIVLIGAKRQWIRISEYIILIGSIVFFVPLSSIFTSILSVYMPDLFSQTQGYLSPQGRIENENNFYTIFKGLPYYIITAYGLLRRRNLKDKIKHYDNYLVLCVFTSSMILMSIYMYWMFRFAAYCYFPVFVFMSLILREDNKRQSAYLTYLVVAFLLFIFTFRYLSQIYFINRGF